MALVLAQANSISVELQAASGGIPTSSPSLRRQTATFLASGDSFLEQQAIPLPSTTQGRPNFTVPSFCCHFCNPALANFKHVDHGGHFYPTATQRQHLGGKLASGPLLQQPFVVGPSFSPIPAKTASQIVTGKYMDLRDLLSVNIVQTEPESQALLDGRLVFLPSTKKQHCPIEDIVTWSKAFTIFTLILTLYFPHR